MPTNRRRQRSIRVTAAVFCLVVGGSFVSAAIVATTWFDRPVWWLSGAAIAVWAFGALAARILRNELAANRRDHNGERAEQAQAYNELAVRRAEEHQAFVTAIQKKVDAHLDRISELTVRVRLAEQRADTAERRLKAAAKQREQDAAAISTACQETAAARQKVTVLKSRIAVLEAEARPASSAEPEPTIGSTATAPAAVESVGHPAVALADGEAGVIAAENDDAAASSDDELTAAPTVVDLLRWDEQISPPAEGQRKRA